MTNSRSALTHLLAPALALPLLLVGCTKLDQDKIEKHLTEELKASSWPVKSVSCPDAKDRAPKKDDNFKCTITLEDGSTTDALVTETDDKGSYSYQAKSSAMKK